MKTYYIDIRYNGEIYRTSIQLPWEDDCFVLELARKMVGDMYPDSQATFRIINSQFL